MEDTNELIVTNDAVSQVSSSEDTVISSGSGERPAETAGQVEPILRMAKKNEVAYSPELASQDNQMQQIPSFSTKVPTSISSSSYISTWKETIKKSGYSSSETMKELSTNFTTKKARTTYSFKPLIDKVPMYYCLTTNPLYFTSTTILRTTLYTEASVNRKYTEINIPDIEVTLGIPLTFWDADDEGYYLFPVFGNTANTSEVYGSTTLPVLTYDSSLHSSYGAQFEVYYRIRESIVYTTEISTSTYQTWSTDGQGNTHYYDTSFTNISSIGTTRFTTIKTYVYTYGWLDTYTITTTCIGLTVPDPIYKQIIPDEAQIQQMISAGKPESGTDVYIETDISEGDIYWKWERDFSSVDIENPNMAYNMAYTYYTLSMDTNGNYTTVPSIITCVYGVMKTKLHVTGSIHTRAKLGQWFVTTTYEDEIIARTQTLVPTTIYWENEEEVIHSTVLWKYAVIYLPLPVHTDDYPNSSGGGEDISEESVQTGNVTQKPIPMAIKADKPVTQNFTVLNAAVSPKGGGGHAAAGGRHAVATGDESQMYLNLLIFLSSAASLCIWLAMMRKRSTAR